MSVASRFVSTCVFNAAPNLDKNVEAARKNARATKPQKLCGIGRFRVSNFKYFTRSYGRG